VLHPFHAELGPVVEHPIQLGDLLDEQVAYVVRMHAV
jgi:hypothetical protein